MRRHVIAATRPRPAPWFLLLLPAVAAMWVLAALLDVLEAEQLLVVALFQVLLLAILGWRVFRALLAPLLFLFFLVPFGAFSVPVLQRFTADFAVGGLELFGIPVFADGLIIQIPEGTFEVAEACAGLRFLIASIVFGCFFATVVYRSKLRRIIFIFLAVLIPILANGLRALGLILLAHIEGSSTAVQADHVLYGWVFFTLITLLLIAVGMTFANRPNEVPRPELRRTGGYAGGSALRVTSTALIGLMLVSLGPGWLLISEGASAAPLQIGPAPLIPAEPWIKASDVGNDWYPIIEAANNVSPTSYRDGAAVATLWTAAYHISARKPLTRMLKSIADREVWDVVDKGSASVPLGQRSMMVNAVTLRRQHELRSVWWFYLIDGHATASTLQAKLLQARALLSGGEHVAGFVAISSAAESGAVPNPILIRFLNALGPSMINDY
jgi:exosortase A